MTYTQAELDVVVRQLGRAVQQLEQARATIALAFGWIDGRGGDERVGAALEQRWNALTEFLGDGQVVRPLRTTRPGPSVPWVSGDGGEDVSDSGH